MVIYASFGDTASKFRQTPFSGSWFTFFSSSAILSFACCSSLTGMQYPLPTTYRPSIRRRVRSLPEVSISIPSENLSLVIVCRGWVGVLHRNMILSADGLSNHVVAGMPVGLHNPFAVSGGCAEHCKAVGIA